MRAFPIILFICFLTLVSSILLGQDKRLIGTFYTVSYYPGFTLVLKPDSTFTLRYRGHISSDTAAGTYKVQGDTLSFKYNYNNYNTLLASYKELNEEVPIDVQLAAGRVTLRPAMLIKKRLRLYVVDDSTGYIKTYDKGGKTKFVYLLRAN